MNKLTLNKLIEEIDKTKVDTFVELPGKIDIRSLNGWTHITKTRTKIYDIDCIVTSLAVFRDADRHSNCFGKSMLTSNIIALETPDGRKYVSDDIGDYISYDMNKSKLPNNWMIFGVESKKWLDEYFKLLECEYEHTKPDKTIVDKIYNDFRAQLDNCDYHKLASSLSASIEYAKITKELNGEIHYDWAMDENMRKRYDYCNLFMKNEKLWLLQNTEKLILTQVTPEKYFSKIMNSKHSAHERFDALHAAITGYSIDIKKTFKLKFDDFTYSWDDTLLYTSRSIMKDIKSALTAVSKFLSEMSDTKHGKVLYDTMIADKTIQLKENYRHHSYAITMRGQRKEEHGSRSAEVFHPIIVCALCDMNNDTDYVPVSKILIDDIEVYTAPKTKK